MGFISIASTSQLNCVLYERIQIVVFDSQNATLWKFTDQIVQCQSYVSIPNFFRQNHRITTQEQRVSGSVDVFRIVKLVGGRVHQICFQCNNCFEFRVTHKRVATHGDLWVFFDGIVQDLNDALLVNIQDYSHDYASFQLRGKIGCYVFDFLGEKFGDSRENENISTLKYRPFVRGEVPQFGVRGQGCHFDLSRSQLFVLTVGVHFFLQKIPHFFVERQFFLKSLCHALDCNVVVCWSSWMWMGCVRL